MQDLTHAVRASVKPRFEVLAGNLNDRPFVSVRDVLQVDPLPYRGRSVHSARARPREITDRGTGVRCRLVGTNGYDPDQAAAW